MVHFLSIKFFPLLIINFSFAITELARSSDTHLSGSSTSSCASEHEEPSASVPASAQGAPLPDTTTVPSAAATPAGEPEPINLVLRMR